MIDRDRFVSRGRDRWRRLEDLLVTGPSTAQDWSELSSLYRGVCADLSTARSQALPGDVQQYLDDLASKAHHQLYSARRTQRSAGQWARMVFAEAPRGLRNQWAFVLLSSLLFYGPFIVGGVGSAVDPGLAELVLPPEQLASMESMYAEELGRGSGEDATMAGFYVYNNVGIAFRCFATGILAGLGSLFYLAYNGLVLGTVIGYLTGVGLGWNLWTFIAGHSAWELTGIVVSGAAGLRMGWALVVTGGKTRSASLRDASGDLFHMVLVATVLLLVAAAIEGFWSASPVPGLAKLVFGALQIPVVAAWLLLGGRR